MNEGKPTKAKWWSRPRAQGTGPDTTTDHLREPGPSGTPGVGAPEGASSGDFELARPATGPASGEANGHRTAPGAEDADARTSTGTHSTGTGTGTHTGTDGDFELERPATVQLGSAPSAPTQVVEDASAYADAPADSSDRSDRPKPLHDPDPYGTPPYGQPGPWAPAPPVQHPAATPAHGTHVPAGTPAQAPPFDAPAQAGAAQQTTGHSTHVPPAPSPAPYATTPHETPVHSPQPRNPWQNYDPWATPGPLQQNGAVVASVAQRRTRARKGLVLGAVVLALVSGGVGGAVGAYLERNGGMGDVELPQAAKEAPGRAPDSVAGIAAHALPSVVTLHVRGSQEEGTGTGFVLDSQGHILTNNHVIEPAGSGGEISVTFSGGETAKASVVGHDSGYDLAVVKVSGVSGLEPMPLGNSDNVQVGDPVVAIGAPFDLANTVTSGIISAKERPITAGGEKGDGSNVSYVDALQTDAPINPGNSGGPLLDSKARVIGINSAIRSADSGSDLESGQAGSIGLGFAIPINQGKRVAEELINTGKATHPVIGVTLDMDYTGDGARVGAKGNGGGPPVTAGGPGAEAGIKAGDIITEVDGERVHSGEELIVKTRAHRPGDRLQLTLRRGGTEKKVTLVLGSADGD
ncbi:S1C family serine protease [Streptomyces lutosisoli]|uniref:Trypsin-like peptidase domain-containing protein n=1 Tax=Streptomyces lutosisoli TaxID=2665721 RepID=A0ABW2VA87_9ACTN